MQIHSLTIAKRKDRKRIGRGGKRGTTAGRGSNGQKSRTGASVDPLFQGGRSSLLERMKKLKGFKSPRPKAVTLTLAMLDKYFEAGETVSKATLLAKKLYSPQDVKGGFKVVTSGELTKKLVFDGKIKFSETAIEAIKASGSIVASDEE